MWARLIHWLEPTLHDLEPAYRQYALRSDASQAVLGLTLLTIPIVVFVLSDYILFGLSLPFALLMLLRLACLSAAVTIGWKLRHVREYRAYDRLVLIWALVGISSMLLVNLTRPPSYNQNIAAESLILMAAYLCIPARTRHRLLFGLTLTGGTAVLYLTGYRTADGLTMNAIWVTMTLANVTGILVARRLAALQRQQFVAFVELKQARDALQVMASTDPLTGVMNRRRLLEVAHVALQEARHRDRPLAVVALDLDHFKQVNDRFGHAAGDNVLAACAQVLVDQTRSTDLVGRIGGEELAIVLPETSRTVAQDVAERIRRSIDELHLVVEDHEVSVTVSLGVAELLLDDESAEALLKRADRALYAAKHRGRNCVAAA